MPVEKPKEKEAHKKLTNTPTSTIGDSLSIAGFAVAVASVFTNIFTLGIIAVVALVLSIMGRVQTSRDGRPSALALAGIIISAVTMFFTLMTLMIFVFLAIMSNSDHERSSGRDLDSSNYYYER